MSLDQEDIEQKQALLAFYRRTLANLLQQAAQFGGEIFVPPHTAHEIAEVRIDISLIKEHLRDSGISVEDAENDDAPPQNDQVLLPRIGGDVVNGDKVNGDKVAGDKVMGEKRTINIQGGDYAEGNIDKRQGAFISGGTIKGSVIGQQTNYQTLPRWLRLLSALAIIIILFVVVLVINGGVVGIRTKLDTWNILLMIQPEQPGETLFVIAPFYYTPNIANTDAHREIQRAIQAEAQEAGVTNLRVELAPTSLRADDENAAEQIGARYNASVVIWGEDTGVRVTVNFLNRRGVLALAARKVVISETSRTQLADPQAYNRFITNDLPGQLSFLALFAIGQSLIINEDYDRAIIAITRAVDSVERETSVEGIDNAYFALGWFHQVLRQDDTRARVMYDRAISLNPKNAAAYCNRGNIRFQQGDVKGAIDDYDSAIVLNPKSAAAYYNRSNARSQQGDLDGAVEDYNKAIALDPKYGSDNYKDDKVYAAAYYHRGNARSQQGDLDGAIEDYNKAIALDPNYNNDYLKNKYAVAYYDRGNARSQQGDLDGAIADLQQVLLLTKDVELRAAAEESLRKLQK